MKRSKTCICCEWFEDADLYSSPMKCYAEPEPIVLYNEDRRYCGRFQWNVKSMQEMLKESEKVTKDSLDFSSKGKG